MKPSEHDPIIMHYITVCNPLTIDSKDIHRVRAIHRNMPIIFAVLAVQFGGWGILTSGRRCSTTP